MTNLKNKVISRITLYADNSSCNQPAFIYAKQYDSNSRYILATIKTRDGNIHLSGTVQMNATKPDGTVCYITGEITDDGSVLIPLRSEILVIPGSVSCDISMCDGSDVSNVILTTSTFFVIVAESNYNADAIEGTEEYTAAAELLAQVQQYAKIAEEAAEAVYQLGPVPTVNDDGKILEVSGGRYALKDVESSAIGEYVRRIISGLSPSGGSVVEVATEEEMTTILANATSENHGTIYKYVGETGTYTQNAYYKLDVTEEA